jgi:hypothetical protein
MNQMPNDSVKKISADYAKNADMGPQGNLQEHPSRNIIDSLHHRRFSGRLLLSFRDKKKKLWFHRGEIFRIQSNLAPELFGQMMVEKGWINEVDLQKCLQIQSDLKPPVPLGEIIKETNRVSEAEIEGLEIQQRVKGLLQAFTWDEGEYEFTSMDIHEAQIPQLAYQDVIRSIRVLLESTQTNIAGLSSIVPKWRPKNGNIQLTEYPVWSILAGCRLTSVSGILSIRKQNKLHEIVIKHGVPLTLYEGTFAQPRQTIVVRNASAAHEKFFIDQLFRLFSFLTGTANFKAYGTTQGELVKETSVQEMPIEATQNTKVIRENVKGGVPMEMTGVFNPGGFRNFLKRIYQQLKEKKLKLDLKF